MNWYRPPKPKLATYKSLKDLGSKYRLVSNGSNLRQTPVNPSLNNSNSNRNSKFKYDLVWSFEIQYNYYLISNSHLKNLFLFYHHLINIVPQKSTYNRHSHKQSVELQNTRNNTLEKRSKNSNSSRSSPRKFLQIQTNSNSNNDKSTVIQDLKNSPKHELQYDNLKRAFDSTKHGKNKHLKIGEHKFKHTVGISTHILILFILNYI